MEQSPEFKSVADTYAGYVSDDRIYLQILENMSRGGVGEFIKHYGSGVPHRRDIHPSLGPVGAFQTIYGNDYEITHIYAFDSLAEMERIRKILFTDPEHMEFININTSPNPPNNWGISSTSKVMRPLPYSPLK